MKKFKIEDIVCLKSGSQSMTVRCEDSTNSERVICNWYYEGKFSEESFYENQLEISDKDEM